MSQSYPSYVALLGCPELAAPLKQAGLSTRTFRTLDTLLARAEKVQTRACVLGPDAFAKEAPARLVRPLRRELPFTDVLVWLPSGDSELVRQAFVAGARDVIFGEPSALAAATARIVEAQKILPRLRPTELRSRDTWRFEGLISRSASMWSVFELCARTAVTDATVLIFGETGTGKELVARAIHKRSQRKGRFVALNCGAVPEQLIDSELFGHVKGAFTSATRDNLGLFRSAEGGTLFLDEIGNIPLPAQYRLLRALQEDTIRPVGAEREIPTDARVIAATSSSLEEAVDGGTFREDLLYRLDVLRIVIPPLRERPEDILVLFEHFSRRLAKRYALKRPDLTDAFLDALLSYDWPGNVRQLENYAERLLLTHRRGSLTAKQFAKLTEPYEAHGPSAATRNGGASSEIDLSKPLADAVSGAVTEVEKAYLTACLARHEGRIGDAAEAAGISRRTLLRKLKAHHIDKRAFKRSAPT